MTKTVKIRTFPNTPAQAAVVLALNKKLSTTKRTALVTGLSVRMVQLVSARLVLMGLLQRTDKVTQKGREVDFRILLPRLWKEELLPAARAVLREKSQN